MGGATAFLMSGRRGAGGGTFGELELLSGVGRKEDVAKRFDITYDTRGLKQGGTRATDRNPNQKNNPYKAAGLLGTQKAELTPLTEVPAYVYLILGGLGTVL